MKIPSCAILLSLLLPVRAWSGENRYDVLSRVLTPWVEVLAKRPKNPNRALSFSAVLERSTGAPALSGTRVDFALQAPDCLRWHGPVLGEEITIVRQGQRLWAAPAARARALLDRALARKDLPALDPKYRLGQLELPLPEKQIVFLPALFKVSDGGYEKVGGADCRVLDLMLVPEVERSLKAPGWAARLWVGPQDRPARISVSRPGIEFTVRFEKLEFAPRLPEASWQPPPEEEVLELDAPHFQQLLHAALP